MSGGVRGRGGDTPTYSICAKPTGHREDSPSILKEGVKGEVDPS